MHRSSVVNIYEYTYSVERGYHELLNTRIYEYAMLSGLCIEHICVRVSCLHFVADCSNDKGKKLSAPGDNDIDRMRCRKLVFVARC